MHVRIALSEGRSLGQTVATTALGRGKPVGGALTGLLEEAQPEVEDLGFVELCPAAQANRFALAFQFGVTEERIEEGIRILGSLAANRGSRLYFTDQPERERSQPIV